MPKLLGPTVHTREKRDSYRKYKNKEAIQKVTMSSIDSNKDFFNCLDPTLNRRRHYDTNDDEAGDVTATETSSSSPTSAASRTPIVEVPIDEHNPNVVPKVAVNPHIVEQISRGIVMEKHELPDYTGQEKDGIFSNLNGSSAQAAALSIVLCKTPRSTRYCAMIGGTACVLMAIIIGIAVAGGSSDSRGPKRVQNGLDRAPFPAPRETPFPTEDSYVAPDPDKLYYFASETHLRKMVDAYLGEQVAEYTGSQHYGSITDWDVSRVTDMSALFSIARNPNAIRFTADLSKWNVSGVRQMKRMFQGVHNERMDWLNEWDVSNVQDMTAMFKWSFVNSPLDKWDVSSVTDITEIFAHSQFNQDISGWNTGNFRKINSAFREAASFNQDLCQWAGGEGMPHTLLKTNKYKVFSGTACTNTNDPAWNTDDEEMDGPVCWDCVWEYDDDEDEDDTKDGKAGES